jgi:hypothetical protein
MTERWEEAWWWDQQRGRCIKTANYADIKTVDIKTNDDDKDVNNDRVAGGGGAV